MHALLARAEGVDFGAFRDLVSLHGDKVAIYPPQHFSHDSVWPPRRLSGYLLDSTLHEFGGESIRFAISPRLMDPWGTGLFSLDTWR